MSISKIDGIAFTRGPGTLSHLFLERRVAHGVQASLGASVSAATLRALSRQLLTSLSLVCIIW